MNSRLPHLFLALTLLLAPCSTRALIMVGRGNNPVPDAGWPEGALAVANLKSRAGYWEGPPFGGGEYQFLYRGDTATFFEALTNFAAIRAPVLELVIHDGPQTNTFLGDPKDSKADPRLDWSFTVWVPASWHHLYNNPAMMFLADQPGFHQPVDPPRLDVYVGSGGVDWAGVTVPGNLRLRDERASAAGEHPVGGALVRVEAFDMATGKPIHAAHVTVATLTDPKDPQAGYRTVAEADGDSSGLIEVPRIPAGTHRVTIEAPGFAPRVLGYQGFSQSTFKKFTTELVKSVAFRGTVTDSAGQPLRDVKVRSQSVLAIDGHGYMVPSGGEAVTDAAGSFEMTNLPTGYLQLWASASGYHFVGDTRAIYETPGTNIVLHMARAGVIQVSVTDQAGKPKSRFDGGDLMVIVEPKEGSRTGTWGGGATVKPDGTCEFVDVPPGDYRITSHPNPSNGNAKYAPEQIITVKPGAPTPVKVVYE